MKYVLLALTLCLCATFVTAQPAPASKSALDSARISSLELRTQQLTHEIDSLKAQSATDAKALGAMDRAVQMTGNAIGIAEVASGILAGVLTLLIAIGLFEGLRWRRVRLQTQKTYEKSCKVLADTEINLKQSQSHVQQIDQNRGKVEELLVALRATTIDVDLAKEPTTEAKAAASEASQLVQVAEVVGATLTANDWSARATHLFFAGLLEQAIDAYDKAIALQPRNHVNWYNKSVVLGALKRHEDALLAANTALAIKPDYEKAYHNKGAALGELERYVEAQAAFDQALTLKPDDADTLNNMGVTLQKLGRHEEALTFYNKALALKPGYASAHFNRACTYSLHDDKHKSLADLKRAIELDTKYKQQAKTDEDLKSLWNDPKFKQIVGE